MVHSVGNKSLTKAKDMFYLGVKKRSHPGFDKNDNKN